MVAFEWRDAIDGHVSVFENQRVESCFESVKERGIESIKQTSIMAFLTEVFESVHRIRGNGIVTGRRPRLRGFSWRGRGCELRGRRENANFNVTLRKPKRLEFLSLVDETIGDSLR